MAAAFLLCIPFFLETRCFAISIYFVLSEIKYTSPVEKMEPEWTKQIPSSAVCNFYYIFYVVYAVAAVFVVIATVGILLTVKMPKGMMFATGLQSLFAFGLAAVNALFLYLICDRSLLAAGGATTAPQKQVAPQ